MMGNFQAVFQLLALSSLTKGFSVQNFVSRRRRSAASSSPWLAAASTTGTPASMSSSVPLSDATIEHVDAVVCGGGPAGLLTAIMLARLETSSGKKRFGFIRLYDRLQPPPSPDDADAWSDVAKFYLIGLGGRGQNALKVFGLWEDCLARCVTVLGRKDWSPGQDDGVENIFGPDRPAQTQVLPRDKLVGVLNQHIVESLADRISLNYGQEVAPVDFDHADGTRALIRVSKCSSDTARMNPSAVKTASEDQEATAGNVLCDTDEFKLVSANLVVAADGTVRTVANAMEELDRKRFASMNPIKRLFAGKRFHVKRYEDDNQRIYKTIPMKSPTGWRKDLNYSARTKEGRVTFDALPANTDGDFCGVLLLKKGDPLAKSNTDPKELRALMDEALPQFSELLTDETIAEVAKKPVSYLPGFRYASPRLHQGNSCVILGDAAHTVKPYFGLGANSALEDVEVFGEFLEKHPDDTAAAVLDFSNDRAPESATLVRISRDLDRPGRLGFLMFVLPIILDSVFSKLAPRIFMPNTISMLQRDSYTFKRVARRKRFDRFLQVSILLGGFTGVGMAVNVAVTAIAKVVGKSQSAVWATMVGFLILVLLPRKYATKSTTQ